MTGPDTSAAPPTPDPLLEFATTLHQTHVRLTQDFVDRQVVAEATWAEYEASKRILTAFRAKYGKVLKALADTREG